MIMLFNIANAVVYVVPKKNNGNHFIEICKVDEAIATFKNNPNLLFKLNELKQITEKSFELRISPEHTLSVEDDFEILSKKKTKNTIAVLLEEYCMLFDKPSKDKENEQINQVNSDSVVDTQMHQCQNPLHIMEYKVDELWKWQAKISPWLTTHISDIIKKIEYLEEKTKELEENENFTPFAPTVTRSSMLSESHIVEFLKYLNELTKRINALESANKDKDSQDLSNGINLNIDDCNNVQDIFKHINTLNSELKKLEQNQIKYQVNVLGRFNKQNSNNMTDCAKVTLGALCGVGVAIGMVLVSNPTLYTLVQMLY